MTPAVLALILKYVSCDRSPRHYGRNYPRRIYETRSVVGRSGEAHYLHSEVDHEEGALLFNTIRDDLSIVETLEVGCGFGLSSLHICKALHGRTRASHTIIDPFQTTQWDGVGVKNLEEAGHQILQSC